MRDVDLRPMTAREALMQIRAIVAKTGTVSYLGDIDNIAIAGLDLSTPENFELIDSIADYFARAIEVLRRLREPEHEELLSEIDCVLALPPDIEAMVERRIGAPRERPETAEQVRLQLADILTEGRAQVLRRMAVEEKPKVRDVLGEMDELIQAMFEQFAPDRWKEELEKTEEAERRRGENDDAIEAMAKAMVNSTPGRDWDHSDRAIQDVWRTRAREALEAYELSREREVED